MASAQDFLEIEEIREGILVLKSKALRGILMTSSLNFALKSEDEQKATIYQFQSFLNSLDFSCQILVQSRKLNITGYIEKLRELEKRQETELMQVQTTEYRKFIETLVGQGLIMSKKFFIIIPFTVWDIQGQNANKKSGVLSTLSPVKSPAMTEEIFQRCKAQLWQRMEFVALGLRRVGLQSLPLQTSEIIEFLWTLHHPKQAEQGYFPEIPPELIK